MLLLLFEQLGNMKKEGTLLYRHNKRYDVFICLLFAVMYIFEVKLLYTPVRTVKQKRGKLLAFSKPKLAI